MSWILIGIVIYLLIGIVILALAVNKDGLALQFWWVLVFFYPYVIILNLIKR